MVAGVNMDNWNEIWSRKAQEKTDDLKQLDGYEGTDFDAEVVADNIIASLNIPKGASLLEVGCGAGALAVHLSKWVDYTGCDKCIDMVKTFEKNNPELYAFCSPAHSICCVDNLYDYVIMYSVAQYFPDYVYFEKVIDEMERVAKKAIFIGDIVETSKRESHLIFNRKALEFKYYNMSSGYYTADRFNIWRDV
jgi:ubiquinone/menaquinone biosynthesis C-methylase UbiE